MICPDEQDETDAVCPLLVPAKIHHGDSGDYRAALDSTPAARALQIASQVQLQERSIYDASFRADLLPVLLRGSRSSCLSVMLAS